MPRTSNPEKKVVADCPVCGKEFSFYKSWPVKTCSMECRDRLNHPDAKTTTQCPECGKKFTHYKSQVRKFCSYECSGKNNIANIPDWKPTAFQNKCEQCGAEYTCKPSATRGRFCSRSCFADWMKEHAPSGPDNPKFGKRYGRPSHLPPPATKTCAVCGEEFVTKKSHAGRRKCCSKVCLAMLQSTQASGANNFNWKGGYSPYYGPNWRAQRRLVRQRDNYTCQRCGITEQELDRELDVHHIRRFGDFANYREANHENNLVSLCPICHLIVEPRRADS